MNPPGLGFICCLVLGIVLLCPAIALLLPSAGLVALLAGMWLELLVKRNMHVAGLWIAMREMPSTAEIATVYPKLSAAFAPTLVGGLLSRCLVVIHDLVRLGATFGYEVMHSCPVYKPIAIKTLAPYLCSGIKKWGSRSRMLDGNPQRLKRRRATLPHPLECSTIAAPGLSYRVRNGTGRLTRAMTTANLTATARKPKESKPACHRWRSGNRLADARQTPIV